MLGITIMIFVIFSCNWFSRTSSSASLLAPAATSAFLASASSLLPCPIKAPISLDILFLAARRSSPSCLAFLFSRSSAITSSTRVSFSSWNFFLIFSFTSSGFSRRNFMSIIFYPLLYILYSREQWIVPFTVF